MTVSPTIKMASKLDLSPDILEKEINHGFFDFAKKHHLANYLETHNHKLKTDDKTDEILILHHNVWITWTEAKTHIDTYTKQYSAKNDLNEPYSLSIYGYQGLQYQDRYVWTILTPLLKGDTSLFADHFIKNPLIFDESNNGYIVEFCSTATEKAPRKMAGDHSWIRLYKFNKIDGKITGKMYSNSLYRPYKHSFLFDSFYFPFQEKVAYLVRNDPSEVWNLNKQIITIPGRITKDEYKDIKQTIQFDKVNNSIRYRHFGSNCDDYDCYLAKRAHIELPTKRHFLELFTCTHLENEWKMYLSKCSWPVQIAANLITKIAHAIVLLLTPFFNLFFFVASYGYVNESIKNKSGIERVFATIIDLFNPNNLYLASPWVLGNIVKPDIESWREREIAKLDLSTLQGLRRRDEITFDFPDSYKISNNNNRQ